MLPHSNPYRDDRTADQDETTDPTKAVEWALLSLLAEPYTAQHLGYFVYVSHIEKGQLAVVAYDARNEFPHHLRLSIEKVDCDQS